MTDREIILLWQKRIDETDPSTVIRQCTEDNQARAYYKKMALGEYGDCNAGYRDKPTGQRDKPNVEGIL